MFASVAVGCSWWSACAAPRLFIGGGLRDAGGRAPRRSSSKIARPSSWVHELVVAADAVPYSSELAAEGILGRRHRVLVLRTGDFERVVLGD